MLEVENVSWIFRDWCNLLRCDASYPNCEADIKDTSDCAARFHTVMSGNTTGD
jgi:hypothetical protein